MGRNSRNIVAPTTRPDKRKVSVIIPAAGFGNRMKSYGPKSLIKIKDDLTIIENQTKYIYRYFYQPQIILVGGFDFHKIENALGHTNLLLVPNTDWENTNVVASIRIGIEHAKHPDILIIYGDLVFNAWTLKAPFGPHSIVLTDRYGLMKKEEVGCVVQKNFVEQIMYSLPNKWAQIAYFTGTESDRLRELCKDDKYDKYFGFELINMIIESGGKFSAYHNNRMRITDIDSSKDMMKIEEII